MLATPPPMPPLALPAILATAVHAPETTPVLPVVPTVAVDPVCTVGPMVIVLTPALRVTPASQVTKWMPLLPT